MIERIAFAVKPLSQAEIAADLGIAKSAVHKHLYTLERASWVMRDPATGRYRAGPKAWLVGQRATDVGDLVEAAAPHMRAARQASGLAVVLSTVAGGTVDVLIALPSTHQIEIGVRQGSRLSQHGSAQGQVMLAFAPPRIIEGLLVGPLDALTPYTLTNPAALQERIKIVRRNGYASAPEETLLGIGALAAPVYDRMGHLIATLGLIGSTQHVGAFPDPGNIAVLKRTAEAISRSQGYRPTLS